MNEEDWGSADWQNAHFPADQLDADGDAWGIRWRGMEKWRHHSYIKTVSETLRGDGPQKILDIGCALCDFTEKAWKENPNNQMYGMDISPTAIDWCSKKFPSFKLKQGALPDLPFEDKFDGVFLLEVICYLTPDERKQTIANIHEALSPNGWLMFSGVLDGGKRHHTEEEVDTLIGEKFTITDRLYNYWWLYRKFFESPLNGARNKTIELLGHLSLSGDDFQQLRTSANHSIAVKLSGILRKVLNLVTTAAARGKCGAHCSAWLENDSYLVSGFGRAFWRQRSGR